MHKKFPYAVKVVIYAWGKLTLLAFISPGFDVDKAVTSRYKGEVLEEIIKIMQRVGTFKFIG